MHWLGDLYVVTQKDSFEAVPVYKFQNVLAVDVLQEWKILKIFYKKDYKFIHSSLLSNQVKAWFIRKKKFVYRKTLSC